MVWCTAVRSTAFMRRTLVLQRFPLGAQLASYRAPSSDHRPTPRDSFGVPDGPPDSFHGGHLQMDFYICLRKNKKVFGGGGAKEFLGGWNMDREWKGNKKEFSCKLQFNYFNSSPQIHVQNINLDTCFIISFSHYYNILTSTRFGGRN